MNKKIISEIEYHKYMSCKFIEYLEREIGKEGVIKLFKEIQNEKQKTKSI